MVRAVRYGVTGALTYPANNLFPLLLKLLAKRVGFACPRILRGIEGLSNVLCEQDNVPGNRLDLFAGGHHAMLFQRLPKPFGEVVFP
ncbi:hypothetical protein IPC790_30315 [Pseudomonas aeruginosa]|nr:hypothetical protein IPC790_30315 [Pseudomonas aeruginosa]